MLEFNWDDEAERHGIHIRIIDKLFCSGTFVSFLAGMRQNLSVIYMVNWP